MKLIHGQVLNFYPLAGYWIDKHNRAVGVALVDLVVEWDDGNHETGRELLPVAEDLRVALPRHLDIDGAYKLSVFGDGKDFLIPEEDILHITA